MQIKNNKQPRIRVTHTSKKNLYALSLTNPWLRAPSLHRVPEGITPTTSVTRHFTFQQVVPSGTNTIWCFMMYSIPDGTYYNMVYSNAAAGSNFINRTPITNTPIIASSNYLQWRAVSASVAISNMTPELSRAGFAYMVNYISKGGYASAAGGELLHPITTGNNQPWPISIQNPATISNHPRVQLVQQDEVGVAYWYPVDQDCLLFNHPGTVEGGFELGGLSGSFNANNIIVCFDNSAGSAAQNITFSVCANYEIESSSTSVTFGNDNVTTISAPAMQTVRKLGNALAPFIHNKFPDDTHTRITTQVSEAIKDK